MRAQCVAGARALTAVFFGATTLYGLLSASAFAYQQFIRPELFPWLAWAARDYPYLLLAAVSLTLLTLAADLKTGEARRTILTVAVVMLAAAAAVLAAGGVPTGGDRTRSLMIAAAALVPPLWLAAIDHLASWRSVFGSRAAIRTPDSRIFAAAAWSCLYVWAVYSTIGLGRVDGPLDAAWFASSAASLLLHAAAFAGLAWILVIVTSIARWTSRPQAIEYIGVLTCFAVWAFAMLYQHVLPALALRGAAATGVAAGLAIAIAACWSGIALRLAAVRAEPASGVELFFRPIAPPGASRAMFGRLVVVGATAFALVRLTTPIDWAFLLQKTGVFAVWLAAWGTLFGVVRGARGPSRRMAIAVSLLLVVGYRASHFVEAHASTDEAAAPGMSAAIDRYAAHDASFNVLHDAMSPRSPTSPEFYRFLSAHANVDASIPIAPTRIDLGPPPGTGRTLPDIFLFVIDSLRPDYLSPYNPAVTFTPNIGAFASESLVFRNAFTRYGGTGLAVPSIFSGSLLPHRQYVLPFAPMNALGRLLEQQGYRFAMSIDSVVAELEVPPAGTIELRAGRGPTLGDFCDTLAHLEQTLQAPGEAPLFAYALPQNLHVSYVASQPKPAADYADFHAPTAAQLRRIDDCFGRFVTFLKTSGRFDQSIIVLTSDHGDSLGEGGRWGHGSAGFPEIFRIPLIVHVPDGAAVRNADVAAVSFSTDIAPTIYTLLGGRTLPSGRLFGHSLVTPDGRSERRDDAFLLTSSYGPVYGLLSSNGSRLYVVDAITARDSAFDLSGGASRRVSVTASERQLNQRRIAEQITEISTFFGYDVDP